MNAVGFKEYFKAKKHEVTRKGKVDIYVKHHIDSFVIELKGFDPIKPEIDKEIIRLLEFLSINDSDNKCHGCYLAFPTSTEKNAWINKILSKANVFAQFQVFLNSERVETGEDPEDGIPVYYANCISITAIGAQ